MYGTTIGRIAVAPVQGVGGRMAAGMRTRLKIIGIGIGTTAGKIKGLHGHGAPIRTSTGRMAGPIRIGATVAGKNMARHKGAASIDRELVPRLTTQERQWLR